MAFLAVGMSFVRHMAQLDEEPTVLNDKVVLEIHD